MAFITAANLGHSFGAKDLFSGINLTLEQKERVGLVGPNGVGKTTLLLILAGRIRPARGSVQRAEGLSLGYLHQEAVLTFAGQSNTVYEEMLSVFSRLREQESDLRRMESEMSGAEPSSTFLEAYGALQYAFESGGGYEYQVSIKRVLLGLGFAQEDWDTPLAHLSGGQKTRLLLGRLLLESPDLLILDEPTNHLDIAAVEWLQSTLRSWSGALVVVSHDRYFLDDVINRVWWMANGQVKGYRGDYSSYVEQRQLEWEHEQQLFTSEAERLGKEIEFIRKHIAGGNSDMAKGKLKRITRDIILMEKAAQSGTLSELQGKSWIDIGGRVRALSVNEAARRVSALRPPANGPPALNIRIQSDQRSGRIVLRTSELTIGYPDTRLFTTDRIRLERLDCAALIGPNGSGKSTFLRTLMGQIRPLSGWVKFGDGLKRGYFAQGHDQLDLNLQVIETLVRASDLQEAEARKFAAQYLFRADDVFRRVGDLSGGERGRLALALLALEAPNFLLLDEPTNHLDIPSQELLQSVLESFDGAILLVSHDRYLVNRLATQIWELKDGKLVIFKGRYQEYLAQLAQQEWEEDLQGEQGAEGSELHWIDDLGPVPVGKKAQRRLRERLAELSLELEDAQEWLERIEYEMEEATQKNDQESLAQLQDESIVIRARLASLTAEWDELTS